MTDKPCKANTVEMLRWQADRIRHKDVACWNADLLEQAATIISEQQDRLAEQASRLDSVLSYCKPHIDRWRDFGEHGDTDFGHGQSWACKEIIELLEGAVVEEQASDLQAMPRT